MANWNKTAIPGVHKDNKGRYRIRLTHKCPQTGQRKDHRRVLQQGTSLAQATLALEELNQELQDGLAPHNRPDLTLTDFAVEWLAVRPLKAKTFSTYENALVRHILPTLGHLRCDTITRSDVDRWCRAVERATQPDSSSYSQSAVHQWWRVLRVILRDLAAEFDRSDPTSRVAPPRRANADDGRYHRETRTLRPQQLQALLAHVAKNERHYLAPIATIAMLGIREGEARALRWDDVDLGDGTLVIRTSKTARFGDATRTLAMPQVLVDVLADHRTTLIRTQHPGLPGGLAFPAARGGQLQPSRLRVVLRRSAVAVGIEQNVTPQVLRRGLNAALARAQVDSGIVWSILGHTSAAMTTLYDHVHPEQKRGALERVFNQDVALSCGIGANVAAVPGGTDSVSDGVEDTGLEPVTYGLQSRRSSN